MHSHKLAAIRNQIAIAMCRTRLPHVRSITAKNYRKGFNGIHKKGNDLNFSGERNIRTRLNRATTMMMMDKLSLNEDDGTDDDQLIESVWYTNIFFFDLLADTRTIIHNKKLRPRTFFFSWNSNTPPAFIQLRVFTVQRMSL